MKRILMIFAPAVVSAFCLGGSAAAQDITLAERDRL